MNSVVEIFGLLRHLGYGELGGARSGSFATGGEAHSINRRDRLCQHFGIAWWNQHAALRSNDLRQTLDVTHNHRHAVRHGFERREAPGFRSRRHDEEFEPGEEFFQVHDEAGETLTVWFDDPQKEHVCEETGDEVVLMKDAMGRVIGFEKLNFSVARPDLLRIAFETVPA